MKLTSAVLYIIGSERKGHGVSTVNIVSVKLCAGQVIFQSGTHVQHSKQLHCHFMCEHLFNMLF